MKTLISSILSRIEDLKTSIKKIFRWYGPDDNIFFYISTYGVGDVKVKQLLDSMRGKFLMPTRHIRVVWFPNESTRYFGGYTYKLPWIFQFVNVGMHWKDKYDSPRYEGGSIFGPSPAYIISIFRIIRVVVYWIAPEDPNTPHSKWCHDDYWEMWLWYYFYCDKDLKKAEETWPWQDTEGKSTWNKFFITNIVE